MSGIKHRKNQRAALCFVLLAAVTVSVSGCRSSVEPGGRKLSKVQYGQEVNKTASAGVSYSSNLAHEQAVSDGCLKAWRMACGNKKEGIAGEEAKAMEILDELDEKHPGISTVQFMMGQVKEHFGKDKEAVFHYKKAVAINEFSSMQSFKLAESMRKSGQPAESIVYYEKLERTLERATKDHGRGNMEHLLASVRLGMAKALIDAKGDRERARKKLQSVLEIEPANSEAQHLLKELETS